MSKGNNLSSKLENKASSQLYNLSRLIEHIKPGQSLNNTYETIKIDLLKSCSDFTNALSEIIATNPIDKTTIKEMLSAKLIAYFNKFDMISTSVNNDMNIEIYKTLASYKANYNIAFTDRRIMSPKFQESDTLTYLRIINQDRLNGALFFLNQYLEEEKDSLVKKNIIKALCYLSSIDNSIFQEMLTNDFKSNYFADLSFSQPTSLNLHDSSLMLPTSSYFLMSRIQKLNLNEMSSFYYNSMRDDAYDQIKYLLNISDSQYENLSTTMPYYISKALLASDICHLNEAYYHHLQGIIYAEIYKANKNPDTRFQIINDINKQLTNSNEIANKLPKISFQRTREN